MGPALFDDTPVHPPADGKKLVAQKTKFLVKYSGIAVGQLVHVMDAQSFQPPRRPGIDAPHVFQLLDLPDGIRNVDIVPVGNHRLAVLG